MTIDKYIFKILQGAEYTKEGSSNVIVLHWLAVMFYDNDNLS